MDLNELLTKLEEHIVDAESKDTAISTASVGWHVEHSLLTINQIASALKKSDPTHYQWSFNLKRLIVFTLKRFPRGKAKSPKSVLPLSFDQQSLSTHIFKTRETIKELEFLKKGNYFKHPFFGDLKRDTTINFLKIHTHHHLRIINDIVNK